MSFRVAYVGLLVLSHVELDYQKRTLVIVASTCPRTRINEKVSSETTNFHFKMFRCDLFVSENDQRESAQVSQTPRCEAKEFAYLRAEKQVPLS